MSTSAGELLDRLRAAQGYERADLLDKIEREYGRGFRKTLQEIVQLRLAKLRLSSEIEFKPPCYAATGA